MGIKCIKSQQPIQKDSTVFSYQNMIKLVSREPLQSQYALLQKIGKGSFAQVYKAKSLKTGHIRAVKKIDRKKHPRIQSLLLNQFDILKQMDHPNILKMYRIYQEYGYFYIVTQLCTGKQLFDIIAQIKSFQEQQACVIFSQLISAVQYLHNNLVMHRDLKPQNIIYDRQHQLLKLVDFGGALRFQNSQPIQRRRIGTSYYIAPQVLKRYYNQKCDVWSSGIILYILLSGQPPFNGTIDEQIIKAVQNATVEFKKPIWKNISYSAKNLIQKMIQRDINKRYKIQQVMKDQWFIQNLPKDYKLVNQKYLTQYLLNMKAFKDHQSNPIQSGVLIFIINFIKNNQDQTQILKCFKSLDLNGDGVLSLQQLTIGLEKYLSITYLQAAIIAKKIFEKVDTNKSGFIDYSQFILSSSNIELTVSEDNLDMAFNYLDNDGNGKLTATQLRQKLGDNISENTYAKLLSQFDKDKDGQISKQQFKLMMKKILKKDK